jgi:catechol 2,3-dioxygenase-like lactoylglutathione lyase family enzyme
MRIAAVTIDTPQPAQMLEFYGGLLGFEPAGDAGVAVGNARLAFVPGDPPGAYHIAFGVPHDQFLGAKHWLGGLVPLLTENDRDVFDFPFWNAAACYAFDAGGNVLELIAHRDLPAGGEPFLGAPSVRGIAEVGVAASDVLALAGQLEREAGLTTWDGDPPSPKFTAVGARGATLIVVPLGRKWYPTDVPNGAGPLEVTFEGDRDALVERPQGLPYVIRCLRG